MNVFVAGAAGAIGRALVPMLVERGHRVVGTTRREDRAAWLRGQGAEPTIVDAHDAEALRAAVRAAEPEVVINELTDIPQDLDPRRYEVQMAGNDRIRREVGPVLAAAAAEAGARRLISQSVAFAYRPEGPALRTEDDPLLPEGDAGFLRSVAALRALERATLETPGVEGVVLRYGSFYGPGTSFARDGAIARRVRRRRFPIVGDGRDGSFSFVHVDDAAAATVAALDRGAPGTYNVVDDEPAPVGEWLPVFAAAIGAPPPRRVPAWLARLFAGNAAVTMLTGQAGASNEKARRELGWAPRFPTWRAGFREGLG